jgi:adenylosuccinate lyase
MRLPQLGQKFVTSLLVSLLASALASPSLATGYKTVKQVFDPQSKNQIVLDIEAALARTQASQGIIPQWAAQEISAKADIRFAPIDEIALEYKRVNHRMVALLNVWTRSMDNGAGEFVHFGATTVDIYDTALILQLKQAALLLIEDLREIELSMITLAKRHRDTPMIGRTLGQHALPITFGKKVSTWLGENRRNIERLQQVLARLERSGILKGAVGTYLGLGDQGIATEAGFVAELGLQQAYADDWHGSRDVLAEYAAVLGIISKSFGRIGSELFLLQMTDIGETAERLAGSVVGSSTMPHKKNPKKPDALIHYSRAIPRLAEVVLDDMVNAFERDSTSRTSTTLADISLQAEQMLALANDLIANLEVNSVAMRANIDTTNGLIMSQRVTFALVAAIGKTTANALMHDIAVQALKENISLREAVEKDKTASKHLPSDQLDLLFDPTTYIGLAAEQVDQVIDEVSAKRKTD